MDSTATTTSHAPNPNPQAPKQPSETPTYTTKNYELRKELCPYPFYPVDNHDFVAMLASIAKEYILRMGPLDAAEINNCHVIRQTRREEPHRMTQVAILMRFRENLDKLPAEDKRTEKNYESFLFYFTFPNPENESGQSEFERKSAALLAKQERDTLEDINERILRLYYHHRSHQRPGALNPYPYSAFLGPVPVNEQDGIQAKMLEVIGGDATKFGLYDPKKSDYGGPSAWAYYSLFRIRRTSRIGGAGGGFCPLSTCFSHFGWYRMTETGSMDQRLETFVRDLTAFQCLLFSAYNDPELRMGLSNFDPRIGNISRSTRPDRTRPAQGNSSSLGFPVPVKAITYILEDVTRRLNHATTLEPEVGVRDPGRQKYVDERLELVGPYINIWAWFYNRTADLLKITERLDNELRREKKVEDEQDRIEEGQVPGAGNDDDDDESSKEDSVSVASTHSSSYRDPLDGYNPADRSTENNDPWVHYSTGNELRSLRAEGPFEFHDPTKPRDAVGHGPLNEAESLAMLQGARFRPFSNKGVPRAVIPEALRDDPLIRNQGKAEAIKALFELVKRLELFTPAFNAGKLRPMTSKSEPDPANLFGVFPQPAGHWGDEATQSIIVDVPTGELAAVGDWSTDSLVVPEWRAAFPPRFLWAAANENTVENILKAKLRELYNERMRQGFAGKNSWSVFEGSWNDFVASKLQDSVECSEVYSAEFTKQILDALWVMVMMDIDLLILAFETMDDYDIAVELIEWDKTRLRVVFDEFIVTVNAYLDMFDEESPSESAKKLAGIKSWTRIKSDMFFEKGNDGDSVEDGTEYSDDSLDGDGESETGTSVEVDSEPDTSSRSGSPSSV